mmetsp:Transcript_130932/g.326667  ORF Transcript_130932/g.326667 Transcript_130932/m.326667 type:complete len:504 (-) Transcript_130932:410-1921(-)
MARFVKQEHFRSGNGRNEIGEAETEEEAIAFASGVAGCVGFSRRGKSVFAYRRRGEIATKESLGWDPKEAGWEWYDRVFDSQDLEAIKTRRLAALAVTEAELDTSLRHEDLLEDFRAMQAALREGGALEGKDQLDDADKTKQADQFAIVDDFFKFCDMRPVLDPIFSKRVEGEWINCDSATWRETWLNPFECLGEEEAACLPPPQLDEWHEPTYDCYCSSGTQDPAFIALQTGASLEDIKKLFKEPTDLLRWQVDGVDGDHQSLVYVALVGQVRNNQTQGNQYNRQVLDYLLSLSPKYFMQQMTMPAGGYTNVSPLCAVLRQAEQASGILAVIQWMCKSGVMTETLFTHCESRTGWGGEEQRQLPEQKKLGIRAKTWTSAAQIARESGATPGMADVIAELDRWDLLTAVEKRRLTEERFEDLLAPALPKKMVSITANGASVECFSTAGEPIATIEVDQGANSAWLIGRIADALGVGKDDVRVVTSKGQLLQQAPAVPLSECSL